MAGEIKILDLPEQAVAGQDYMLAVNPDGTHFKGKFQDVVDVAYEKVSEDLDDFRVEMEEQVELAESYALAIQNTKYAGYWNPTTNAAQITDINGNTSTKTITATPDELLIIGSGLLVSVAGVSTFAGSNFSIGQAFDVGDALIKLNPVTYYRVPKSDLALQKTSELELQAQNRYFTQAVGGIVVDGRNAVYVQSDKNQNIVTYIDENGEQYQKVPQIGEFNKKTIEESINAGVLYALKGVLQKNSDGTAYIPNLLSESLDLGGYVINSLKELSFVGDSLTYGTGATSYNLAYPVLVANALGRTYVKDGIGGSNSQRIAARYGAIITTCTIQGGVIPDHGSVTIENLSNDLLSTNHANSLQVEINGVVGNLVATINTTTHVFTRNKAGSAVSSTGTCQVKIKNELERKGTTAFWIGRNDASNSDMVNLAVGYTKSCVNHMLAINKRYVIMSVINASNEYTGGAAQANYDRILLTNAALKREFMGNYLDIRKKLVDSYNPSLPNDVIAYGRDCIPPSLQSGDGLHLNDAGYQVVANNVAEFLTQKGY